MISEKRIRSFWQWFEKNASHVGEMLDSDRTDEVVQAVGPQIHRLHKDLDWEVGPGKQTPFMLTISAKSQRKLRPETDRIVAAAPLVAGWEFYPALPPREPPPSLQVRNGDGIVEISTKEWLCQAERNRHGKLDLIIVDARLAELPSMTALHGVFIFLDKLLGEDAVETCIGAIEVGPAANAEAFPIRELVGRVEKLRN